MWQKKNFFQGEKYSEVEHLLEIYVRDCQN